MTQSSGSSKIAFNKPHVFDDGVKYLNEVLSGSQLSGDGKFTELCHQWLQKQLNCKSAFLTHSGTGALEMAALLLDLKPGDEVIMPSFTFTSTANAVVLRGATPVFVDVRPDTMNIDEKKIEAAITKKTKAICVVHYAGVGCEMDTIMSIAAKHGLKVFEDAAQAHLAFYKNKPLGAIAELGCLSFHDTKNVIAGEGGALICRDDEFILQAEIFRQKGTNRKQFIRGQVDKYTWVDVGSSFLPSEIVAALLYSNLQHAEEITANRVKTWNKYYEALLPFDKSGRLSLAKVPSECKHNGHIFFILLPSKEERMALEGHLRSNGIMATFHYVPLHSSPAGQKFCRSSGDLNLTEDLAGRLLRLPIWYGFGEVGRVVDEITKHFKK